MIPVKNLPQRVCFVGLAQRFGFFKLNNLVFTLISNDD